ncbi:MAG: hypothetical protein ACFE0J_11570 [Elainellaceae cyanobacterium]
MACPILKASSERRLVYISSIMVQPTQIARRVSRTDRIGTGIIDCDSP